MRRFFRFFTKHPLIWLNIPSGAIIALSFTIPILPFLTFFCFIPLILAFYRYKGWFLYLHMAVFSLSFWISLVHWAYIYHVIALPLILVLFLIYSLAFSFIAGSILQKFSRFRIIIFPILWVGYEYFISLGYLGFPWGTVGASLHSLLPFIQIADITGIWGVSFFILLINALLAEVWLAWREKKKIIPFASMGLAIMVIVLGYGFMQLNVPQKKTGFKVGLVQGNLDPNLSWEDLRSDTLIRLTEQTEACVKEGASLVAWWETPIMDYLFFNLRAYDQMDKRTMNPRFLKAVEYDKRILDIPRRFKVPILTGMPDLTIIDLEYKYYNSAVLIGTNGENAGIYYKMHLVPFGEWFPFAKLFPFIKKILESLDAGEWTPGTDYKVFETRGKKFSVAVCYEGIFGYLARQFVLRDAEFLVNITDDMWSYSPKAELQHSYLDVFRAVENRVSFVRAANSGNTCMIDPHGRMVARIPLFQPGHLTVEILDHPGRGKTLYTRFGDWLAKFCLAIMVGLFLMATIIKGLEIFMKRQSRR
jgi:apolipoprotein N-acyltransferase